MLKTIATKELRETAGIGALALICYAVFVGQAIGIRVLPLPGLGGMGLIPFVDDPTRPMYWVLSGGVAVALGLRQSALETAFGTDQFVLHRPLARRWIFGMKLVVGASVYLVVAALPILVYAWWAATPGTHASPFRWSMTLEFWKGWLAMTVVYLGGFLSGLRPGLWKGTRLLPLAAAVFLVFVLVLTPWYWGWGAAAVILLDGLLVTTILYVARTRDY